MRLGHKCLGFDWPACYWLVEMNHKTRAYSFTSTALMVCWLLMTGCDVQAAWTKLDPPPSRAAWSGIASSADGTRMAAVVEGGQIWVSTDAGATWGARASAGTRNWKSIAISGDGTRIAAFETTATTVFVFGHGSTTYSSEIWLSNDGGSTWSRSIKRTGGYFKRIVISPDGIKIAAVGYGGVWISINGGLSWTQRVIPEPITSASSSAVASSVFDVIVQPDRTSAWNSAAFSNGGGRLWVAGFPMGMSGVDDLWISDDDGTTWSKKTVPSFFSGKIVVSEDGQKVMAANAWFTSGKIWTSGDGGTTWAEQNVAGYSHWADVAISSDGLKVTAASADGGLWFSSDGGVTWKQAFEAGNRVWKNIACSSDGMRIAAAAENGGLWTSGDAGATWRRDEKAGGNFVYRWQALTMSEDGTRLAVAEEAGGIWTLNPNGPVWTERLSSSSKLWTGLASSGDGTRLAAAGYNINSSYITPGNLWASTDFGQNWGLSAGQSGIDWRGLAMSGDGSVMVAAAYSDGVLTSPDQGITWTPKVDVKLGIIEAVTVSTDGSLVAVVASGALWMSADQGQHWTYCSGIPRHSGTRSLACSSDGSRLVVADYAYQQIGSIWTSQDRGVTWVERTSAGVRQWKDVASSGDGLKMAAAVVGGSLWTSTDGGATWTECAGTLGQSWQSITCSQDGLSLAAAAYQGGIWRSLDGGTIWSLCQGTQGKSWSSLVSSGTGDKLAAVGPNGSVWTSLDQGSTWVERSATQGGKWLSLASSLDGSRLIAASSDRDVWVSTDGGASWQMRSDPGEQYWTCITSSKDGLRLAAASRLVYGAGGIIHTSVNGGVNWTAHEAPGKREWVSITSSRDGRMLYAVDNTWNSVNDTRTGSVWASHDSGATWKEQTQAGRRAWATISSSGDGRRLVAATSYGPILTSEDYGATWTLRSGPGNRIWTSVAWSGDGSRVAAATRQGGLWSSTDGGKTWQETVGTQSQYWTCIRLSDDGHLLAVADKDGSVWINDVRIRHVEGGLLTAPTAPVQGTTQYQWLKDGVAIRDATSSTFTPPAGLLGAGSYSVRLTTTLAPKVTYTESSPPTVIERADPSLLIYKLSATGISYVGTTRSNSTVTGYLIVDRTRQRGGLIWQQTFGKQKTHTQEVLENLQSRSTATSPQGQMVITDLTDEANGAAAALWLNGSINLLTLRKAAANITALQVMAPATLSGYSNLALDEGGPDSRTWRIETTSVKATLAIPETTTASYFSSTDTVESVIQRISQSLKLTGSILRESE